MQVTFEQLSEARERVKEYEKLQKKQQLTQSKINQLENEVTSYEVQLDMEKADVEKLEQMSIANLFYTMIGTKERRYEKERQEMLEAALRLQEAKQSLKEYKQEYSDIIDKLMQLSTAEQHYKQLLEAKEQQLRAATGHSEVLDKLELDITERTILLKELKEALTAGKGVTSLLDDALRCLEKAEEWGSYDMFAGGGLVSTHIKHGHIDDASRFLSSAARQLDVLKKELQDIKQSIHLSIDIGSGLTLADYFLDGLFTDWLVQDKIINAKSNSRSALRKVKRIVESLNEEVQSLEIELSTLQLQRKQWIEQN